MDKEINTKFDELGQAFNEFKQANDQRLKEIEQKGAADTLLEEKTNKINGAITEIEGTVKDLQAKNSDLESEVAALKRSPQGDMKGDQNPAAIEYKNSYELYLKNRLSDDEMRHAEQKAIEAKGLSTGGDSGEGFAVPTITETSVYKSGLEEYSKFRQLAKVQEISSYKLEKLIQTKGAAAKWVGELEERNETDAPEFKQIVLEAQELFAEPRATQRFIDDSVVNVDAWLAGEISEAFAVQETHSFINGDGDKKPTGILGYEVVNNSAMVWGKVGAINSGAAATLGDNPYDTLIDLVTAPDAKYRNSNAAIIANKLTIAEMRKVKDSNGNYIWQMGNLANGTPSTILGYRNEEINEMPDIAAGTLPIAFGDFKRAYTIVDRMGIRILVDPYTSKPFVKYSATKRVGGGVTDFNAFKLIKIGA